VESYQDYRVQHYGPSTINTRKEPPEYCATSGACSTISEDRAELNCEGENRILCDKLSRREARPNGWHVGVKRERFGSDNFGSKRLCE
jgi:hypothetical protein